MLLSRGALSLPAARPGKATVERHLGRSIFPGLIDQQPQIHPPASKRSGLSMSQPASTHSGSQITAGLPCIRCQETYQLRF
jgi:hypothetical protein